MALTRPSDDWPRSALGGLDAELGGRGGGVAPVARLAPAPRAPGTLFDRAVALLAHDGVKRWPRAWRLVRPRLGVLRQHAPRPFAAPAPERIDEAGLPAIALVTPSRNQGVFIERTLRSVLDQAYPRLEYVVRDGGSTDGTREILERYAPRLHAWFSGPDGGQADAINQGFATSSGEIMGWLNSDDLLLPGALHHVGAFFRAHPEIDAVYGQRVLVDAADREIGRWVLPAHHDDVLTWVDVVPQETLFWRRSLWERSGGRVDPSFSFALDWDLLLRFREAGARFARLPRFLGAFRVHERQKTTALVAEHGLREKARLRARTLGHVPDSAEIRVRVARYFLRHFACHMLYRAGLRRYGDARPARAASDSRRGG